MKWDTYCTNCKRDSEVVFDHAAATTVCSECGRVLVSTSINETSEWRTFADDSGNALHGDAGLSTVISKAHPHGSDQDFSRLQSRCGGDPDRAIGLAFKAIANMADRLNLATAIKDRATEIYTTLEDQKCTRGRNLDALVAACIFIACRQDGKPRTMKEIHTVANEATKKEIGRAREFIVKRLKLEMGESATHAGDYLRRFCSNLLMSNEEVRAVQETVHKAEEFDIRRSPISIAAATILMITQLSDSDKKPSLREISVATTASEGTIKNAYKDLFPHAATIIPEWFDKGKEV